MSQPSPSRPRKLNMTRNRLLVIIVAMLLVIGLVALATQINKKPEKPHVATETATRGDITKVVAATGRVVPNFEVEIKAKASGKIVSLPYEVSDYVRQGTLLVELDPVDELRQVQQSRASLDAIEERINQSRINYQVARREVQTELEKAQANLSAAEARLKEAQAKRNRLEQLYQGDFISREEYEAGITTAVQAQTDVQNARTRFNELNTQQISLGSRRQDVEIARAEAQANRVQVLTAEQRLSETRVYAPITGYITSKAGQIGQIVASGISNVGGGTAIMTLADLSRIFVLAAVDESDIGQVGVGQAVNITADAFPGEIFEGRVVQVASKGVNEADVVTFEVKIEVVGPNKSKLKPEMTANTEIIISKKHDVVLVPAEAVSVAGNRQVVSVLTADNNTLRRRVVTGINNGTHTEIISGIRPGDRVVVNKGEVQSEWRKKGGNNSMAGKRRAGQMMMRGGGRR